MVMPKHPRRPVHARTGRGGVSRRSFLQGSMAAAAGLTVGRSFLTGRAGASTLALTAPSDGPRTVDHTFDSFFDVPMPRDVWEQRANVGYGHVRSYHYPVVHEWADFDGPDLVPNQPGETLAYGPGRWKVKARGLSDFTIDTIGGVRSPAPDAGKRGFLPRNLMGGLQDGVEGGTARLKAHLAYIGRQRAEQLKYPFIFGYHGWEAETNATITMDPAAAQKILGITAAQVDDIESWWADNREAVEQQQWWWLLDEGGDEHVGGIGRLNVRYAFDTPMQMWLSDLDLSRDAATGTITMSWDWVSMAGDMLFSRWISEALGIRTGWETNSLSDVNVDLRVGPESGDLDVDTGVDYLLYKLKGTERWVFEASLGDVPNLTTEYLGESSYRSSAFPYADGVYGSGDPYTYTPGLWNLRDGESITLDFRDVAREKDFSFSLYWVEPTAKSFEGQITKSVGRVTFEGPMDMAQWSSDTYAEKWAKLATETRPDGLAPWGSPYVEFLLSPSKQAAKLFADPQQAVDVAEVDRGRAIPAFPQPDLGETPALEGERTVKVDLYSFLDVPMVADRWREYEENEYQQIESLRFPVSYRTSEYFPPDPQALEPFSELSSGLRFRVAARNLPGITIDTIGGGSGGAGFLPRNLMGGLAGDIDGGTAEVQSRMRYGTREREAIYRLPKYWGYYGWENFWDVRLTLDRAAAQKILGVTAAQLDDFEPWFAEHVDEVRDRWRQWFYREFLRLHPMAWFNYPIQIWAFPIELASADADRIVLEFSVLNEALDVVMGRWFTETFLPHSESSWDDLYLNMTIGPESADVDLDGVTDWALAGYGTPKHRKWWWEPYLGDNPYLANEYRLRESPAWAYRRTDFTYVPSNWNLKDGEQLNLHFGGFGLRLLQVYPDAGAFPEQIEQTDERVSFTGPLDLAAWSKATYPEDWAAMNGRAPFGLPQLAVEE